MSVAIPSDKIQEFFENLDHGCGDLETFKTFWDDLVNPENKHPSRLSFILDKSVKWVLSAGGDQNLKEACLDYIKSNINLWHKHGSLMSKKAKANHVSIPLWAMSKIGVLPYEKVLQHVEDDFFAKDPNAQAIANVMTAFKDMGHKPSAKFLRHVEDDFFAENPDAQAIVNVLFAMADLGYMPSSDFLNQAQEILQKKPDKQNIANTLWACAVFASLPNAANSQFDFKNFAQELLEHAKNEDITFSVEGKQQVFDACYLFDLQSPVQCPKSHEKSGSYEKNLTKIFNDAFLARGLDLVAECDEKKDIDELNRSIDLRIRNPNTGQIIAYLEYDGTDHMVEELKNGKFDLVGYNGRTGLQTLLIHKAVPDTPLLRMPYFVRERLEQEDEAARDNMIADYFSALANGTDNNKPKILTFGKEGSAVDYPLNPEYLDLAA